EAVKEFGECNARRIDSATALRLGDQTRALDLSLALCPLEGMPTALALAGLRVAHVDDDGPVTGRAFTDVAFHFFSPSSSAVEAGPSGTDVSRHSRERLSRRTSVGRMSLSHSRKADFAADLTSLASAAACSGTSNDCSSLWTISAFNERSCLLASCAKRRRRAS